MMGWKAMERNLEDQRESFASPNECLWTYVYVAVMGISVTSQ